MKTYFPDNITSTKPEGGMFLWVTLPPQMLAMDLFNLAVKEKVVFVPGEPFYVNNNGADVLRLNFSCVDKQTIDSGINRLGKSIYQLQEMV